MNNTPFSYEYEFPSQPAAYSANYHKRLGRVIRSSAIANRRIQVVSFDLQFRPNVTPRGIKRSAEISEFFKVLKIALDQQQSFDTTHKHNLRHVWRRMRPSSSSFFYRCYILINYDFYADPIIAQQALYKLFSYAWAQVLGTDLNGVQGLIQLHSEASFDVFSGVEGEAEIWQRLGYLTEVANYYPANRGRTFGCSRC